MLVSEPLAYRYGAAPGREVTLLTERGQRAFPIAGVYSDYGSEQGVVMLSWRPTGRLERPVDLVAACTPRRRGCRRAVGNSAARALADQVINIRSNRALREASLEVFDRTFAITTVLRMLAMIVAFVGILAALMALQLERARELGMLRANGLTPRQLWGMVLSQTGLMGLTAGLLAIPVGVLLAGAGVCDQQALVRLDAAAGAGTVRAPGRGAGVRDGLLADISPASRMARRLPAAALCAE